jgi:hypothetical protein
MWVDGATFIHLILADALHTILVADFVYYYAFAKQNILVI